MKELLEGDPLDQELWEEQRLRSDKNLAQNKLAGILNNLHSLIQDKNKCFDIFWNVKIGQNKVCRTSQLKYLVKYRIRKQRLLVQLSQVTLLKYLRAFSGFNQTIFLHILLRE